MPSANRLGKRMGASCSAIDGRKFNGQGRGAAFLLQKERRLTDVERACFEAGNNFWEGNFLVAFSCSKGGFLRLVDHLWLNKENRGNRGSNWSGHWGSNWGGNRLRG